VAVENGYNAVIELFLEPKYTKTASLLLTEVVKKDHKAILILLLKKSA
jgi:hypothetical protein